MLVILDTNIFLRFFLHEPGHDACAQVLEVIKKGQIKAIFPGIVVAELVWVLKSVYQVEKDQICQVIKAMSKMNGLELADEYDYDWSVQQYAQHSVKYIDTQIGSIMQLRQNISGIVSFDKDFDRLQLTRFEPAELLDMIAAE